jgi:hypothetical protein
MGNPILDTRMYAKITGIALAAVALLGIVLNSIGQPDLLGKTFLAFDWTHNILHVVLAAVALYVGFAAPASLTGLYAKVFGIVYAGLGVAGFFWIGISATVMHLELGENLVHLLIGVWGIACGFFGTTAGAPAANAAPATPPKNTTPPRKA